MSENSRDMDNSTGNKKTPIIQFAINTLKEALRQLENDECDEEKILMSLSKLNNESTGKYDNNSFVTYDEAMRMLNVGNRNALKKLLDANNVKQNKIGNIKVGFLRSDIEKIAAIYHQH